MKPIILMAALLWISIPAFSQKMTLQEIENGLNKTYQVIMNNQEYGPVTDSLILGSLHPATSTVYYHLGVPPDSLESYNSLFDSKMEYYTSHYSGTLTWPFDSLGHEIQIVSSKDLLFRIYTWNRWEGGTMQSDDNIFQFKSNNKVYAKLFVDTGGDGNEGPGIAYYEIYTLKANNKTYYLAIGESVASSGLIGQSIQAFTIEDHTLNNSVKLIKYNGRFHNSIEVVYDFTLPANSSVKMPGPSIKYSDMGKILSIPVVDENGKVTNRYLLYQFNGKYFQFIKTTGSR
jgi:hypothetical protein